MSQKNTRVRETQWEEVKRIDAILRSRGLLGLRESMQELIRRQTVGGIKQVATLDPDITTVPDLSAEKFIAFAKASFKKAGIPFTYWDNNLVQLIEREMEEMRGKTFKVMQHIFSQGRSTEEGRALQTAKGFNGNPVAFMAWIIEKKPMGYFASIPNEDSRLWRSGVKLYAVNLYAPYFRRDADNRHFDMIQVAGKWPGGHGYSLVGFRAI